MKKILWIDTETTGLDPTLHSLIEIGAIVDIDGIEKETIRIYTKPHPDFEIDDNALAINKITRTQIKNFPEMLNAKNDFCKILSKYVDKFDKNDKFTVAGQNIKFDIDFLYHFFTRLNDNYLGSYIDFKNRIELYELTNALRTLGFIKSEKVSISSLCKEFNIKINAHEALSDISATREIYYTIIKNLHWTYKKDGK